MVPCFLLHHQAAFECVHSVLKLIDSNPLLHLLVAGVLVFLMQLRYFASKMVVLVFGLDDMLVEFA